jgi:hypothetical protein
MQILSRFVFKSINAYIHEALEHNQQTTITNTLPTLVGGGQQ